MGYRLLGGPVAGGAPHYRGIERHEPSYSSALPEDAPVNRAWREYVDYGQELPSLDIALRLANEFAKAGQQYEVVHVERTPACPRDVAAGQLGYDVCWHSHASLLTQGLQCVDPGPAPRGPLLRLIEAYFRPLLNENGLFEEWNDARFFLDVVEAVATVLPGTWEAPGHEQFEIVRLISLWPR